MKKLADLLRDRRFAASMILPLLCLVVLIAANTGGRAIPVDDTRGNTDQEDVVWYVPTDEKVIALTFDDGPDPVFTPKVLDILNQYDVHATFFVIGKCVDQYPDIAKEIVEQGSEIANHTYTHANLSAIGVTKMKEEIKKADKAIMSATGVHPSLFRPPHGTYNDTLVEIVRDMGYKVVLWSWTQDTIDWCNPGTSYIINKVLGNAQNGDIIIFHDAGGDRNQTVMALEPIIQKLQDEDFQLLTVSELLTHEGKEANTEVGAEDVFIYE